MVILPRWLKKIKMKHSFIPMPKNKFIVIKVFELFNFNLFLIYLSCTVQILFNILFLF